MTTLETLETIAEITLDVRGMTCASCVAHVEGALTDLEGVSAAAVNLGLGTARVSYLPGLVTASQMKRAVHEAGYEALERSQGLDALDRERQAARKKSGVRAVTWSSPARLACW